MLNSYNLIYCWYFSISCSFAAFYPHSSLLSSSPILTYVSGLLWSDTLLLSLLFLHSALSIFFLTYDEYHINLRARILFLCVCVYFFFTLFCPNPQSCIFGSLTLPTSTTWPSQKCWVTENARWQSFHIRFYLLDRLSNNRSTIVI